MAAAFVGGAAPGAAFGEGFAVLHDTVKNGVSKARMFKPMLKRLESTLDRLVPTFNEIRRLSEQLELPERETKRLMEQMEEGAKLVRKCLKIRWWNYVFKVQYSPKLDELDKEILRFCQVDLHALCTRNGLRTLVNVDRKGVPCTVRDPPDFTVGLDMPMKELKTLLLKEEVQLLLLTAPGGCGKTTLVQMLCQDDQIRGMFEGNILFVNVSKTPNVKVIVQNLLDYKNMQPNFQIQSDEDAINQLSQLLNHLTPNPILLILDDVWLGSESLPEKFKFDLPNYKILVTSRTAFPRFKFTYHLKPLDDVDAMTLFHHSASLHDGSSYVPAEEDVKKIVRGCGGFPLVIKVIGGSLRRQHEVVWHSRLTKWSDGQFYFSSDTELLAHLQKSLEFSDDNVIIKECFMDLGSFPEDQRIPAAALIDMWAELYELDEDGIHAIANLQELNIRNLASLVMARKDASEVKSYYNEDFVTQDDILRELAMHQSSQESIGQRSRLIINISGNNLPKWWTEQTQQLINARLLSISTDELFSSSWCNIQGSKVEVLVLNFHTKNYTLPEFVEKMDKLKVLIINNYGFFHSKISNFQLLGSLPNLKRIRLEKVSIPSLCKILVPLKSLKKISLFMCNIGKAFENCTIQVSDAFPNLTEINIDHCNDLEELPAGLCDIIHLKKISITNCHKLFALPKEIGKLVNLEVLRLRSCIDLSKLPDSIRSLHKLSILDICGCLSIMKLPKHIGELCNLKELNMKGCLRLCTQFPESIMDLKQLKLVVCDKEWAKLWEPIKEFLSDLEVEVAEKESVNLSLQKLDSTIRSRLDFTAGLVEVASAGLMEPLLLVDSLSHSDYMSARSSLSSSSSSSLLPLPKPQALPLLELGIFRPKERSCSVDFLFPSPKTCPRRGLEDRDRDRDRDSACSNSPIRSEFASCETTDVKKSMDYGDKSCRQENPEKNGFESSREIISTEMIPGLHPPAFFGYTESVPMNSQWLKGKHIGCGAFGHVYVAINRETGAFRAMKEVVLIPDDPGSAKCIMQLQQEIKLLSQLKHPNIVQYYGSEIVNDRFYIYLEYVHPGSIRNYVREYCEAITESVVRNFTRHILSGLAYLHGKNIIHRDIKGANLLVDLFGVVKLADFGLAKHLTGPYANLSVNGSYRWMAPEIFKPDLYEDHCRSSDLALAVDIWSLGCTIIEMITGKPPWSECEVEATVIYRLGKGMTPPIPETLSPVCKEFLSLCLKINPADRPSAASLLEHPFMKNSEQLDGN